MIITKDLKEDYVTPKHCDFCESPAEIWWTFHLKNEIGEMGMPDKGIPDDKQVDVGFCSYHAIDLICGLSNDIRTLKDGKGGYVRCFEKR